MTFRHGLGNLEDNSRNLSSVLDWVLTGSRNNFTTGYPNNLYCKGRMNKAWTELFWRKK